ncbi:outer membrane lipoprotein-sorting protein [Photobacterium kishitanii]|uniref:outer membrane lipoprotein-sorting protein n=1 Tax=Photobacterium kishitanii TaxID=318456 RepID=UPI0009C0237B
MFNQRQQRYLSYFIKLSVCITGLVSSLAMASNTFSEQQVQQMLSTADSFRLQDDAAKVVSLVTLYQHNEVDKTRQYNVYTRANRQSLVIFKSAVEAGQKMLMLGDNYWLQMPKTRRPIRITPMQKLLGEASVGDISTLAWRYDYKASWYANENISDVSGKSVAAYQLKLIAVTAGVSYQKIDLWIDKLTYFPLRADLYLASGKLAKQAIFSQGIRDDKPAVVAMTLLDSIQPSKKTVIEYQQVVPWKLDDKYYTPSFLSRSNTTEL